MITIFTTPKPFVGKTRIAQINALTSWKQLSPNVEVIIYGQAEGTAEVASELNLVHIPNVTTNEFGTPLISAMFESTQLHGHFDLQAYVNCDIILLTDFLQGATRVSLDRFLMVGQRWDLDLDQSIDFSINWQDSLNRMLQEKGSLHAQAGSDYFIYPRGTFRQIPPLVVGRAGWDNWMIYYCLIQQIPVIDATPFIAIIHQNHPVGARFIGRNAVGEENIRNLELAPTSRRITLQHSSWILTHQGLHPKRSLRYRIERLIILPQLKPHRYRWLRPVSWVLHKGLRRLDRYFNGNYWLPEEKV